MIRKLSKTGVVPSPMDEILLTFDQDWAPDHVMQCVAEMLIEAGVRSTWFITHDSPILDVLREFKSLFELGVHPNFLPGSSHGGTPREVLRHCLRIVPEARSLRAHSIVQSGPLQETILSHTPLRIDVTQFLPRHPFLRPYVYEWKDERLLRVPYYWEDDYELHCPKPSWRLNKVLGALPGLKVLNFHPIAVFLNLKETRPYQQLKARVGRLQNAEPRELRAYVQQGTGCKSLLTSILKHIARSGPSRFISEVQSQVL